MINFGEYIKSRRVRLGKRRPGYSQRQVALRIGIEPSYLSKLERGLPVALSEEKTVALARELETDPDFLLALSGKVSSDVQAIITKRPSLFAKIVREMKELPDDMLQTDHSFRISQKRTGQAYAIGKVGSFYFSTGEGESTWSPLVKSLLQHDESSAKPGLEALTNRIVPEEREKFREGCRKARLTKTPIEYETILLQNDGSRLPIRFWAEYEYDDGDNAVALLGGLQDISETVQLRQQFTEANALLEARVESQDAKLHSLIRTLKDELEEKKIIARQLEESRKRIADESIKQQIFFRETCHAIRSLLNNALQFDMPDFLPHNQSTPSHGYPKRILNKINDIIDFASLNEKISPAYDIVNVNTFTEDILKVFAFEFNSKKLPVTFEISPSVPDNIIIDAQRLNQIIYSILEYAIVANEWGSIQITMNIVGVPAMLSISFSGIQYDGGEKGKYYFNLTKMDWDPTPRKEICLGMVEPILENMNGHMELNTPQGQSSRITISFPVAFVNNKPTKLQLQPEYINILIVEDDAVSGQSVLSFLQKKGCKAILASNSKQALIQARTMRFDIILMDIQLPDKCGVDVATEIGKDGLNENTPIVAVTAYAMSGDRDKFLQSGLTDYMAKPIDYEALYEKILRIVETRHSDS